MPAEFAVPANHEAIIRRYPVVAYFTLTFLISWTGVLDGAACGHLRPTCGPAAGLHLRRFPVPANIICLQIGSGTFLISSS
jgi:hypothetical protein